MYEKDEFNRKYTSPAPPLPPPHQHDAMTGYNYPTSPPPPFHGYPASPFDYSHEKSFHDSNYRRPSFDDTDFYQNYSSGYQPSRGSMSDIKLTSSPGMQAGFPHSNHHHMNNNNSYDTDNEDDRGMMGLPIKRKRSCLDKLCCGCCTCCPRWARYCSCIFLLLVIALGIVIGVLASLFKMPQVSMSGLENQPSFNITNGNTINMAFQLEISVDNPNIEGITFDSIVAKAYYPNHHDVQLGGGEKDNVVIAKQKVTTFTFPFAIKIDISNPDDQSILNDLFSKCGLDGSEKQPITIDYDVIPTVKFGLIPISITISKSTSMDCPSELSQLGAGGDAGASLSALAGSS